MGLSSAVATAVLFVLASSSVAHACSAYEQQIYNVAKAVEGFRNSSKFKSEYGWSAAGPFGRWLDQIKLLDGMK